MLAGEGVLGEGMPVLHTAVRDPGTIYPALTSSWKVLPKMWSAGQCWFINSLLPFHAKIIIELRVFRNYSNLTE